MKNVVVVGLGGERHALELRWVREIFTLAALTPVPTAPAVLEGVVNFKGTIVPVLDLRALVLGPGARRTPQTGDALVLVEVEGTQVALAVDRIDAVTALAPRGDELLDPAGVAVPLADPATLVAAARLQIEAAHGARG
jgi:purine-binding chemotaxis protein CheW